MDLYRAFRLRETQPPAERRNTFQKKFRQDDFISTTDQQTASVRQKPPTTIPSARLNFERHLTHLRVTLVRMFFFQYAYTERCHERSFCVS